MRLRERDRHRWREKERQSDRDRETEKEEERESDGDGARIGEGEKSLQKTRDFDEGPTNTSAKFKNCSLKGRVISQKSGLLFGFCRTLSWPAQKMEPTSNNNK